MVMLLWRTPTTFGFPVTRIRGSSSKSTKRMSLSTGVRCNGGSRQLPILLFDVMDTIVRDPFYTDVPAFFRHHGVIFISSFTNQAWLARKDFSLLLEKFEQMCQSNKPCYTGPSLSVGRSLEAWTLKKRLGLKPETLLGGTKMPFKELIDSKHPTAWIEFEEGQIDEMELARKFFSDGRPLDLAGLKDCMQKGYSYLEGVEELLHSLKQNGYEMHAFTNYPIWYKMIEEKLKLSTYLSWTFCSCIIGKRKPHPTFYSEVLKQLDADPATCIFIDDRIQNVNAAKEAGMVGLQFKSAELLRQDLSLLGVSTGEK